MCGVGLLVMSGLLRAIMRRICVPPTKPPNYIMLEDLLPTIVFHSDKKMAWVYR